VESFDRGFRARGRIAIYLIFLQDVIGIRVRDTKISVTSRNHL
jgi:hypothetical protein